MAFELEPGPLQYLDPSRFPQRGQIAADMETILAPASAQLFAVDQGLTVPAGEIAADGIPDLDGEHATVMGPALAEAAWQAQTEHELDLGTAYVEAQASAAEFDGLNAVLPAEDSEYEEPCIPGEGDDGIEVSNNPGDLGIGDGPIVP